MNKHAKVIPISKKAKNRLANLMNGTQDCHVEQENETQVFLASINKKYFFWVNKVNDENWLIVE